MLAGLLAVRHAFGIDRVIGVIARLLELGVLRHAGIDYIQ